MITRRIQQIAVVKRQALSSQFVPKNFATNLKQSESEFEKLSELINQSKKLFVLSGAGVSTESGIPDYRSPQVGLYSRSTNRPLNHSDFLKHAKRRKMYWARNYASWPLFSSFEPNESHRVLAQWERENKVWHHVTQNVDSLFVKAGCKRLTELHGTSYQCACVNCGFRLSRSAMQTLIESVNKGWSVSADQLNPDNDIVLKQSDVDRFHMPVCPRCKTDMLKPEVVFFGDSIPKTRVQVVNKKLDECDAFIAIGTTIQVYSAYRLVLRAKELNIPIMILNIGETRGDKHANVRVNSIASQVLSKIKLK